MDSVSQYPASSLRLCFISDSCSLEEMFTSQFSETYRELFLCLTQGSFLLSVFALDFR